MASFNQATVIGFLGDEPKIILTQSGRKMAAFSVATTEKGFTRQDGTTVPERTEWHNIVLWGRTAEVAEKYLHKGSSVMVQGKMRTRSYDAKDGSKKYITEIEGDVMQMLDRAPQQTQQPAQQAYQAQGYQQQPYQGYPPVNNGNGDMPF